MRRTAEDRAPSPFAPVGGWQRADLLVPLVIFVLLFVVKIALVTSTTWGPSVDDERLYWRFAGSLAQGANYDDPKYPPVYPAAIAPAFHLPGEPYSNALTLNALYSSLLVFPVWGIARLLMGVGPSTAVALLQCLLPFHYIMPRILFSENVYYPLFAGALFMVLWRPERRVWAWDAATGVVIAALYLTRYVSLPIIPALVAVWWLREWQATGRFLLDRAAWGRLLVLLGFAAAAFLPWVAVHRAAGVATKLALGFGIASRAVPEQLTLDRLWLFVRMYLAYYALLVAPLLGLVFLSAREALRERALSAYTRTVAATGLVSLALLAALSRHSWRVHYNWPDPVRIMGRYTIYLAALFLVVAVATLLRLLAEEERTRSWWTAVALLGVLVPAAVLGLSHYAVLGDGVMPFTASSITDRGSVDAYRIQLMGPWFWALSLGGIALVPLLLARLRRGSHAAMWALAAVVAAYSLVGVPAYFDRMGQHQTAARHSREIVRTFDEHDLGHARVLISASASGAGRMVPATALMTMRVFREGRDIEMKVGNTTHGLPRSLGRSEDPDIDEKLEYAIVLANELEPGAGVLREWEHDGIAYALIAR